MKRYPAHAHLIARTEAQFFRAKPCFKKEAPRPMSATLIIPHPLQDNKFFYGAFNNVVREKAASKL